ncbi:amidohydrolase family protein, partial [uncultured Dokdonia sp.]|uniref:amidohydrolase family protein n=1 Tax=uncultured Dokdonia sp. TaxID=575653 RepID=UPI002622CA68
MIKVFFYSFLGFGLLLLHSCSPPHTTADLIILNGKVVTVDSTFSIQEAVAVKDKKIVFVGSQEEVQAYRGESTQLIDASDMLVLPGLIDAHAHLVSLGNQLSQLYTSDSKSYEDIVEKVRVAAQNTPAGEWIIGGRWDHNTWEDKTFPWPGASNVKFPLLTIAALQFSARAYPSLISGTEVVKVRTIGDDPAGQKAQRAKRVSQHM